MDKNEDAMRSGEHLVSDFDGSETGYPNGGSPRGANEINFFISINGAEEKSHVHVNNAVYTDVDDKGNINSASEADASEERGAARTAIGLRIEPDAEATTGGGQREQPKQDEASEPDGFSQEYSHGGPTTQSSSLAGTHSSKGRKDCGSRCGDDISSIRTDILSYINDEAEISAAGQKALIEVVIEILVSVWLVGLLFAAMFGYDTILAAVDAVLSAVDANADAIVPILTVLGCLFTRLGFLFRRVIGNNPSKRCNERLSGRSDKA